MKSIVAVSLLAGVSALAQGQPQATSVQNPSSPQPPQPQVATTNLAARFNGPTLSEIYCSGFISKQPVHASGVVQAGSHAPEQVAYAANEHIFLQGDDVQEGKEYLLLRHTQDPNRYQSYPGQLATLSSMGELYEDLGRAKVLYLRGKIGVAQIENSCAPTWPGDIAVPFQERSRPEFRKTEFSQFASPNGKTTGTIVMGRDLDTEIGARRIVYLNIGEAQGVKPGDYFRVTRSYKASLQNPSESLDYYATQNDDTQKHPPKFNLKRQVPEFPRRSVGELMVTMTTGNSATALTTYAPEDIRLGDGVEMIDAVPFPAEPAGATAGSAAAVQPPQPPTISCSSARGTLQVGESATIVCNGTAEEGHQLTYNYQTSAGQIAPHGPRATLTATAAGPVTVTATAVDDRNLSAQTTVNLAVEAPAPPPTPTLLNELSFKPNGDYVDNRAKAALDDDALRLQREPSSTLVLEGYVNPSERDTLAASRANNAKTYLTRSKGLDPNRIQTRTAAEKTGAKVLVIMVPAGVNAQ